MRAWNPRWKLAAVACAGALSFVLPQAIRTWMSDEAAEVIVEPADRKTPASRMAARDIGLQQTPPVRMSSSVSANPFGPLGVASAERPDMGAIKKAAPPPSKPAVQQAALPTPVPSPPPPAPEPQGPPTAPPLPFVAVGAIQGSQVAEGRPVAFLRQRDEVLAVRPGDSIGNAYRVVSISADRVDLLYLPLNQRQSLPLSP